MKDSTCLYFAIILLLQKNEVSHLLQLVLEFDTFEVFVSNKSIDSVDFNFVLRLKSRFFRVQIFELLRLIVVDRHDLLVPYQLLE